MNLKMWNRLLGGILLVASTTIGAGMLALPVSTGMSGFIPSVWLLIIYWFYMAFTAFLVLEVSLWMPPQANLVSMARATLGKWGEIASWLVYLFLLYALMTAYVAGSTSIINEIFEDLLGQSMLAIAAPLALLLLFGVFVSLGTKSVDYFNRFMMIGMFGTFFMILILLAPFIDTNLLSHTDWKYAPLAVSVIATSFGFHIIIPSLKTYLHDDVRLVRLAIYIGSLIPLAVYLVWEYVSLGIIPLDTLIAGYREGQNGANLLENTLNNPSIDFFARTFSFFAIVSSFVTVALSLSHFLVDGLRMKNTPKSHLLLYAMTFLPPIIITLIDPRAFLSALEAAGGFGVVVLLGLFPALMVWSGRYVRNFSADYRVGGGKPALLVAMALSLTVVIIELANKLGLLHEV